MSIPDETSLVCDSCGLFNFEDGTIIKGIIRCDSCSKRFLGSLYNASRNNSEVQK